MIKRALISVSDKRGITEFASELRKLGVEIISTGGTGKLLSESGIEVMDVSEETGFPELFNGRVKTLHPRIHGGLLNVRDKPEHQRDMKKHGIMNIDLLVCNLYPFKETVARDDSTIMDAIENIDVGGPAMVRAAAKNFHDVTVIMDPSIYDEIIMHLRERGEVPLERRKELAAIAFKTVSNYDSLVYDYLIGNIEREGFPDMFDLRYVKNGELRYGENPHQEAVLYKSLMAGDPCIANARQLQGKQLSFNNIVDLDSALQIIREFERPSAVIIKHTNPCGMASADSLVDAYKRALDTDSLSAFGGIVGLNKEVDDATAEEMSKLFLEAVIAPSYSEDALSILKRKKNLRLMEISGIDKDIKERWSFRQVSGGILLETPDRGIEEPSNLKTVTQREPSKSEIRSLLFAWKIVRNVKSNAAVLARDDQIVGVGAGQMSRVDAVKFAIQKSEGRANGSVMASEAFLPFRDSIDEAANAGITAIIQPGGSIRDKEVIDAADEYKIAMLFTGKRCFKH